MAVHSENLSTCTKPRSKVGATRRQFLSTSVVAGAGAVGLGDLLRLQAEGATTKGSRPDTAVIHIWLGGGPSQFETFDPKPEAPVEIRGCYSDIATNLPGVRICETLPRHAQILDKVALIRTITHPTNNHEHGTHLCVTGHYVTTQREMVYPAAGSLVAKLQGPKRPDLPPYVQLRGFEDANPQIQVLHNAGYLGAAYNPFTIKNDPNGPHFQVGNLELVNDLTLARMTDRRWLLSRLDNLRREIDASGMMTGMDQFNQMALAMVTGRAARDAFDLSQESPELRDKYGRHRWGQSALLARRLVEAGVPFVTINTAPDSKLWDWHLNLKDDSPQRPKDLGPSRGMDLSGPPLDQMVTALVEDLYERGLDKKVLVLMWGEFGRTPRINKTGGRDHWGSLMSILLAGGGLKVGQVIGASNSKGEMPIERPVAPGDVLAMVYRHLGLDTSAYTVNNAGRPIPVLPEGKPIAELI